MHHQAITSFGFSVVANCARCGGPGLNSYYFEDGKWWHPWCAPSTRAKDAKHRALDILLTAARKIDTLKEKLDSYDAACKVTRGYL